MISAVLLAAGESRRMGDFKQLLSFAGKTFVECCVDNLLASRVDEVVVVTGHREAEVRNAICNRQIKFAHNPDYTVGMSTSIKRGVQAISESARAVLIALADQPQIGPDVINQVVDAYKETRSLIVVPTFKGRNGHPIVIDLTLKNEVLAVDPAQGLRQLVHAHVNQITHIEVGSSAVLEDFDYPEDYQRVQSKV